MENSRAKQSEGVKPGALLSSVMESRAASRGLTQHLLVADSRQVAAV